MDQIQNALKIVTDRMAARGSNDDDEEQDILDNNTVTSYSRTKKTSTKQRSQSKSDNGTRKDSLEDLDPKNDEKGKTIV